ncbi:tail fiber domain-containing protein, partial [Chryseobacterium sp.]|uniref:tail fiber domain-containing protein n=1 Tax=Chryseobacterium sp. TaxID=1871047 RepID=UPI0028A07AE1
WVDTATNTSLAGSTTAEFYPVTYTVTNNSEMPMSKAVITPTADINVAFRVVGSTGTADMRGNQSYAIIKQLNACGGGGGNTTIVNNNVTASNGLTASSNNVKLGGTLSEATSIANAGNNLTITGAGSVGIGTATPRTKLEVAGGPISTSAGAFPNTTNMAAIGWNIIESGVGFNEYVNYRGSGNGGHRFYSLVSGAPTEANSLSYLNINGAWSATAYNTTSDVRLKRNIKPVENGLQTILKLNPVSYEKKTNLDTKEYKTKEIGFVAQEIREVLPDMVAESEDENKLLSVNYDSLIPVLTKAVQELNSKVDELNAKVQKLESENSELKKKK